MRIHHEGFLYIKSQGPLITWACNVSWKARSVISLLPHNLCLPNLARWWFSTRSFNQLSHRTIWISEHTITWSHVKDLIHISTTIRSVAIICDKVVTFYEGLPPIKSQNVLNTWHFGIRWQTKKPPITQCLKPQKLAEQWPRMKGSQP